MKIPPDYKFIEALRSIDEDGISTIFKLFSMRIYQLVVKKNKWSEDYAKTIFIRALEAIRIAALEDNFKLSCSFEDYLYHVCRALIVDDKKLHSKDKDKVKIRDFRLNIINKQKAKKLAESTVKKYLLFERLKTK